jgi:hypothetical protein
MDIQERVQLLSTLDVVVPAAAPVVMGRTSVPAPITGAGECGLIVGSAMHGCIDGLTVANKYAVVNSQLLAERAASAKFDNETQPIEWFKRYVEVLRICGWTTQGSEFTTYSNAQVKETVEQATVSILTSLGGAHAKAYSRVITRSFAALRINTRVSNRFHAESTSTSTGSAKFRILPCMQTTDEHVLMVLTSIQAATKSADAQTNVPGHFWERVIERTDIRYGAAECMLNMGVYNSVKTQIEKKLVGNTLSLIDALDLG